MDKINKSGQRQKKAGQKMHTVTKAQLQEAKKEGVFDTRAGKRDYDAFFQLESLMVKSTSRCSLLGGLEGRETGICRIPLGFIPGEVAILSFREGRVQIIEATPGVKKGMKIPTPWQKVDEFPNQIRQSFHEWKELVEGLGYEPSPWSLGFARGLLEKRVPPRFLAIGMPNFRYRPGDPELPFGVTLIPEGDGMKLERLYNPQGIPDLPAEGSLLTLSELKDGKGPVQKLLRTWAIMEGNYASRYARNGQPRR